MLKVYIASAYAPPGSGPHRARLERAFAMVREYPEQLEVAHDWVARIDAASPGGDREVLPTVARKAAHEDFDAILEADFVWVVVPQEGGRGMWVELGYTLANKASDCEIVLSCEGDAFPSIFCHLVTHRFHDGMADGRADEEAVSFLLRRAFLDGFFTEQDEVGQATSKGGS